MVSKIVYKTSATYWIRSLNVVFFLHIVTKISVGQSKESLEIFVFVSKIKYIINIFSKAEKTVQDAKGESHW